MNATKLILILMTILTCQWCTTGLMAQSKTSPGKVELIQDKRVPALVEKHIALNDAQTGVMEGYRIQIYFDSGNESKKHAMDARSAFIQKHPDIPAYLTFQEPFFKVRVGDFRTKLEADGVLQQLLAVFPNAYTVRDKINFPKVETP